MELLHGTSAHLQVTWELSLFYFRCEVKETVSSQEELQRRLLWCWERLSLWTHAHLVHTRMYTSTTHTNAHIHTDTYYALTHTHICMHTHAHIHMYTYAYQHTHALMYTYYTHTKCMSLQVFFPFMNLPTVSLKREDSVCVCM